MTHNEMRELKIKKNKLRRARQLRLRMIICIALFLVVFGSAFGITSFVSKAQNSSEDVMIKEYTSVMVPYGFSLSEMAEDYIDYDNYDSVDQYIGEVLYINHMDSTDIQAGTFLIMPYYESI